MQRGIPATEPVMTADEKEAASLLVEQVAGAGGVRGGGGGGAGAAGGGGGRGGAAGPQLGEEYTAEFSLLLGKKMTALQIRDFLSGEFTPVPLADVMAVLKAREASGAIKLTPVPPAPVRKK
jgi:hypothetical protein